MVYNLDQFCQDTRKNLKGLPLSEALDAIAADLSRLLGNQEFVNATFSESDPAGKKELFHDQETDFYVYAHIQAPGKTGAPHSHGASWAVYGNAMNATDMTEYRRANPDNEEAVVLQRTAHYALTPGKTRGYGPGVIHSTAHAKKAWVVRVTGTDLDQLPRFHFKRARDRILEEA